MRRVFLYGTLRSPAHLSAVLGHEAWRAEEAALAGHRALWDRAREIPVIVAEAGARAPGLTIGVGEDDLARLDFYELPFGYARRTVTLEGAGEAICYFPDDPGIAGEAPFDLVEWEARFGALAVASAREVMADFGRLPPGALAGAYRRMLGRGWSRVLAERGRAPGPVRSGPGRAAVRQGARERLYTGFFALDRYEVTHPTFRGGEMTVSREVFRGYDAALVLPYDPVRDRVALIEQFRAGPYGRGDPGPWVLEPVAGLVDPGEMPEACARREALEEAGLTLGALVPVGGGYPSPGATTEFFHLFVGLCDLGEEAAPGQVSGLAEEGEDIRTHILSLDAALDLIESGEVNVIPLAYLLTWTAARRARLAALA